MVWRLQSFSRIFSYLQNGQVAIYPKQAKLITTLRTAVEDEDSVLDTDATSHDDLLDAFRMSFAVLLMTYSMFYTTW